MSGSQADDGNGIEQLNNLPESVPDEMENFIKSLDAMQKIHVTSIEAAEDDFNMTLEYDENVRLVKLKALGQDLGVRGFEAIDDFRPGEDMKQAWRWTRDRYESRWPNHD